MSKRPLIIDCDPGSDDALAIMMLQASGCFNILGITPVQGNVSIKHTARNSVFLSKYLGINCPVYVGADHGIILRLPTAEYAHGANGLADFPYELEKEEYGDVPAWEFMWQQANKYPGELEIIATGPLTNVAIAVKLHPEIVKFVKQIVIMGGSSTEGNASPLAEYNIYQDPHGAQIVFEAGFKDLTLVDLNTCYAGTLNKDDAYRMLHLPDTGVGPLVKRITEFRIASVENWMVGEEKKQFFRENLLVCDAVAAAVLIDPSIASITDRFMFVEHQSSSTSGQTVVDWFGFGGAPNVHLAQSVDREAFAKMFFDSISFYDQREVK